MKELITREYKGIGVHFEVINGESYVLIDDIARFCGWTRTANSGNEVIMWSRVNNYLEDLVYKSYKPIIVQCYPGEYL